jgi:hypothetical protein
VETPNAFDLATVLADAQRKEAGQPLRALTASVSCGATLNKSPTMP